MNTTEAARRAAALEDAMGRAVEQIAGDDQQTAEALREAMVRSLRLPLHPDIERQIADVRALSNVERVELVLNLGSRALVLVSPDAAPPPQKGASWAQPSEPYVMTILAGTH